MGTSAEDVASFNAILAHGTRGAYGQCVVQGHNIVHLHGESTTTCCTFKRPLPHSKSQPSRRKENPTKLAAGNKKVPPSNIGTNEHSPYRSGLRMPGTRSSVLGTIISVSLSTPCSSSFPLPFPSLGAPPSPPSLLSVTHGPAGWEMICEGRLGKFTDNATSRLRLGVWRLMDVLHAFL